MKFSEHRKLIDPAAKSWRDGELPLVVALHDLFTDKKAMAEKGMTPWGLMTSNKLKTRGYTYARYLSVWNLIEKFTYDIVYTLGVPACTVLNRLQHKNYWKAYKSVFASMTKWINHHNGALPGYTTAYYLARTVAADALPDPVKGSSSSRERDRLRRQIIELKNLLRAWLAWSKGKESLKGLRSLQTATRKLVS